MWGTRSVRDKSRTYLRIKRNPGGTLGGGCHNDSGAALARPIAETKPVFVL